MLEPVNLISVIIFPSSSKWRAIRPKSSKMPQCACFRFFVRSLPTPFSTFVHVWNQLHCRLAYVEKERLRTYHTKLKKLLQTDATNDVVAETSSALMRYTQPSTTSPTQYKEPLAAKLPRCGKASNEYTLKGVLIRSIHNLVCHSMRSYRSAHLQFTLYDLGRHATSLRVLLNGTDDGSAKIPDHPQNTKHRRGRRENHPSMVNVFITGGSTPRTPAMTTLNTSMLMKIGVSALSIPMPSAPRTIRSSATYVYSSFFDCLS